MHRNSWWKKEMGVEEMSVESRGGNRRRWESASLLQWGALLEAAKVAASEADPGLWDFGRRGSDEWIWANG